MHLIKNNARQFAYADTRSAEGTIKGKLGSHDFVAFHLKGCVVSL